MTCKVSAQTQLNKLLLELEHLSLYKLYTSLTLANALLWDEVTRKKRDGSTKQGCDNYIP